MNAELNVDPLSWLKFTFRGGLDASTDDRVYFFPKLSAGAVNGELFQDDITENEFNFDANARQYTNNTTEHHAIQYNTIQYNTIQYDTIQYNTIQYNTIQYNTVSIVQYSIMQYNTIRYDTIQNIP